MTPARFSPESLDSFHPDHVPDDHDAASVGVSIAEELGLRPQTPKEKRTVSTPMHPAMKKVATVGGASLLGVVGWLTVVDARASAAKDGVTNHEPRLLAVERSAEKVQRIAEDVSAIRADQASTRDWLQRIESKIK